MNRERLVDSFIEMIKIYSPSKGEKDFADYMIEELKDLGGEIYLDHGYEKYGGTAPSIVAKFKGDLEGEGISLAAHMDVVEPNKDLKVIREGNIIRTDGSTTLGGDDKGGIASILETLRVIKEEGRSHEDIYVILTPCEEIGMLGAKYFDWSLLPEDFSPAKNMIVVDNAGEAGLIAHSAPSKYDFTIEFFGRKAHAGIEPEKGINSISMAAKAIAKMEIGRIDELTTSNISKISSDFPSNVVPDRTLVLGEVRSHSEEKILEVLASYEEVCKNIIIEGADFKFEKSCDYPVLKPKDKLEFANEFKRVYEELGIASQLKVIGGGSDSNIFAEEGFNSIIIGIGMNSVHTVDEYLEIDEMEKTTKALIKYITKE